MLSTVTWISSKDIFKELFDISSYRIETPIFINAGMANLTDDLLIDDYIRTPLYKGLVKHVVRIQGSEQSIIDFNYLIQNDLKMVTFTTKLIKVEEILGFTRQLQIALYRQGYKTTIKYYIHGNTMTFVPMMKEENLYVPIDLDINVESFIGYKPLVDLYIDPVSLKIAASDLIFECDLTHFDYIVNNIPVVEVNGQTEKEVIATRAEFAMDKLLPIVSKIIHLNSAKKEEAFVKINVTDLNPIDAISHVKDAIKSCLKTDRSAPHGYKNSDIKVSSSLIVSLPDNEYGHALKNKIQAYVDSDFLQYKKIANPQE